MDVMSHVHVRTTTRYCNINIIVLTSVSLPYNEIAFIIMLYEQINNIAESLGERQKEREREREKEENQSQSILQSTQK